MEMMSGLNALATIARLAPWVGILGTMFGLLFYTFRGVSGEKLTDMAAIAKCLSDDVVPAAAGLLIALMASWFYRYLLARVESFDSEMEAASLQLVNTLSLFRPRKLQ